MKLISLISLILLLNQILLITTVDPQIPTDNQNNMQFNAVYRIDSLEKGYPLITKDNKVLFSTKKEGKEESFRILSTGKTINSFYIISKILNKRVGINDKGEIILYQINESKNVEKTEWNFIKINNNNYLIQNSFNKKYLEVKNRKEKRNTIYYPICKQDLNKTAESEKISNTSKFSFLKLYEEVELKPEHIEFIEKEPIDVLIKYIDLTDKTLDRKGITQIKKDEDNEELRYAVRSIMQYIPWIRKIFILMPNEKVRFFKPYNEINNKIVYVKDKDIIGFDSANSVTFQLNLGNMKKFGLSENFILMDDDYFFGKPIKKTDFFYYDENLKKVLPSVVTDDFTEMIEKDITNEYNKLYRRRNSIKPHSFNGWKISQLASFKLLLEQFKSPLINAGFSHNAIPLNINDLIEIHNLIKAKYKYAKEVLTAKVRTVYDLQPQSLFNSYALNVKKRKVNSIPSVYYDIVALDNKNFDIEMFVMNTSGDRKYTQAQYDKSRNILAKKFNIPTPFEAEQYVVKEGNVEKTININDYVKKETCTNKDEYNKLKKKMEEAEKIKTELSKTVEQISNEKKYLEIQLQKEINFILNNLKTIDANNYKYKYISNNTSAEEELLKTIDKYNYYTKIIKILIVILLIIICICFFCIRYLCNYQIKSEDIEQKEIQLTSLLSEKQSFSKLSTDENNL